MSLASDIRAVKERLQNILENSNAAIADKGGAAAADLSGIPEAIAGISGGGGAALEPLGSPAAAENIQTGYQAYDSDGNVIEGNRDFEGEIQSLTDENSNLRTENDSLSAQLSDVSQQRENSYQEGYNAGYSDGSGGLVPGHRPLSYTWDEDTLTLTVQEVSA